MYTSKSAESMNIAEWQATWRTQSVTGCASKSNPTKGEYVNVSFRGSLLSRKTGITVVIESIHSGKGTLLVDITTIYQWAYHSATLSYTAKHFYTGDKFMQIRQNEPLYKFRCSGVLCISMYGTIKFMRYKFMWPALNLHDSHK